MSEITAREVEALAREMFGRGPTSAFYWDIAPESTRIFWRDVAVERLLAARKRSEAV